MTIVQICLVVVVNLLAGTYMAQVRLNPSAGPSFLLATMILVGFAMIWRSVD